MRPLSIFLLFLINFSSLEAQLVIGGDDRVDPSDFDLSLFADSLNFPVGMVVLGDNSVLTALSEGSFLASNSSRIVRLIDSDGDGVSDDRILILEGIPIGRVSDIQLVEDVLVVTGQGGALIIYELVWIDQDLSLNELGNIVFDYPSAWLHLNTAIALRKQADGSGFEIYSNIGSQFNWDPSTDNPSYTSSFGLSGSLVGDSIYCFSFEHDGSSISGGEVIQIASGLRNAAGLAFHPDTGDLYFQDNGIDGVSDPNEPVSADEINFILEEEIGGDVEYFGFPGTYTEYRSDIAFGNEGRGPYVVFQPLGDPNTGAEAEGANDDIAFAPKAFPEGLNNGIFVGFHGKFLEGGLTNEENPLVFVDLADAGYFHFVDPSVETVGHLDGLAVTDSSLFIADISPFGSLGSNQENTGKIYKLKVRSGVSTSNEEVGVASRLGHVVYPNPFQVGVSIDLNGTISQSLERKFSICIYDGLGRLIREDRQSMRSDVDLNYYWNGLDEQGRSVPPGLYFASIRTSTNVGTVSMVKSAKF